MTNREIDKEIAEFMGWEVLKDNPFQFGVAVKPLKHESMTLKQFSPTYFIGDAFLVVEKIRNKEGFEIFVSADISGYCATIMEHKTLKEVSIEANTPSMAICLAALETLKEKKEVKKDGKEAT